MSNSGSTESTPKIPPHPPPAINKLSDTSSSSPVILTTPSVTSEPEHISLEDEAKMESNQDQVENQKAEATPELESAPVPPPPPPPPPPAPASAENPKGTATGKKIDGEKDTKDKKARKPTKKGKGKKKVNDSSASDDSDADSESEDSTEDEKNKRRKKRKAAAKKAAAKKKAAKEKAQRKKNKNNKKADTSEGSSDDSSDNSSASESSSSSDSDSEDAKKKTRRKAAKAKAKAKKKKSKKADSSSDDSDSDLSSSSSSSSSDSDLDSDNVKSKRKGAKAKRKAKTKTPVEDDDVLSDGPITITTTDGSAPPLPGDDINTQVAKVSAVLRNLKMQQLAAAKAAAVAAAGVIPPLPPKAPAKKNAHEFKRVDQVWDTKLRDYKLVESTADQKDEFECVFTVRRRFNWEGKLRETLVDIKSKALRGALQVVLKECKCVSLVEDIPEIDPHILYHYYDEIKKYVKKTLKPKLKRTKKSKDQKQLTQEIAQCKLLLGYVDEDYAATRKALKPLLKAGTITYELCWALFKPNTIVFTPTYGNKEDPRCFKVEQCFEYESWLSGAKSCCIDGKYLEYDGQVFGLGDHQAEIKAFKGHKKITSLVAYPLKYHKDPKVSRLRPTKDYC